MKVDIIKNELNKNKNILNLINAEIFNIEAKDNKKDIVFCSLLDLSLEHYKSIMLLVNNNLHASAYSIFRPQLESIIRALYIINSEGNGVVDKFIDGNIFNINNLIKELSLKLSSENDFLSKFCDVNLKTLHGMTHGGIEQVNKRVKLGGKGSGFEENEIVNLLVYSRLLASWAACSLCEKFNLDGSSHRIVKLYVETM